jgi:hypothetical protein
VKLLTYGLDSDGRSCVIDEREITTDVVLPGLGMTTLFQTREVPPVAPPPGSGVFGNMGMVPGSVNWMMVDIAPHDEARGATLATEMHYNNTIELFCVLEGSMISALDDGPHVIERGDCVAMPGVDHATFGGPDGARVLNVSVGLAPPG